MSKNLVSLVIGLVAMAVVGLSASADGGPPYRRTTPRGSFGADGPQLVVGVPGGRAWGIESGLVPVPDGRAGFRATLEVSDPLVREAFVRVAWYDRAGETATVEIALDPPAGAVAYRLRVLARLRVSEALSTPGAVRVTFSPPFSWPAAIPPTRLLP